MRSSSLPSFRRCRPLHHRLGAGAPAAILIAQSWCRTNAARAPAAELVHPEPVAARPWTPIVKGTQVGLTLLLNIVAMLLVFVALVHLANAMLGLLPEIAGAPITLQRTLGLVMAPVCWLIGIPWDQAATAAL
jgi:concentrative nucleoside transporter, CNT family